MELQHSLFDESPYIVYSKKEGNSNCDIGTFCEINFMSEAVKNGFVVFTPIGHSQKADLIVWKKPNRPISVQVKKGVLRESGTWQISTSSKKPSCLNSNKESSLHTNYVEGDFDVLAAHIVEQNCWALWRLKDISGKSGITWDGSPKNNFELLNFI